MAVSSDSDRLKNLTKRVAELEDQIRRFQQMSARAVAVLAVSGFVLGFILPFLMAAEGYESMYLLPATTDLAAAGGGPYSSQAALASIVVGVFALVVVATGIAVMCTLSEEVSARTLKVTRVLATLLLVGCGGIWLLVLTLSGMWEGRVSGFSPAAASYTVGAILALVTPRLVPKPIDFEYRSSPRSHG